MGSYRKNVSGQFFGFQLVLAASGAAGTGLTPAVRRCIDGTFADATGSATEDGTTGNYKFALSQADTNGNDISFGISATGCIPQCVCITTTAADPTDGVRLGLTALPNAAAGANGGLPLSVDTSGRVDVLKVNGTSQTAKDLGASATQTGDNYARLGAPAGASVSADIAAAKTDTGAIKTQTDKLAFSVANQIDANVIDWKGATAPAMTGDAFARLGAPAGASMSADIAAVKSDTGAIKGKTDNLPAAPAAVGDIPTAAAITSAVLDEALAGHLTAGTVGKAISDGAAGGGLDAAGVRSAIGMASANLDTQLSGIDSKTTNLPSDPADESLIIAATDAIMNRLGAPAGTSVSADVAAVKAVDDAVKVKTDQLAFTVAGKVDANAVAINGDATAAANLAKTTRAIARGTVDAGATTSLIPTSAFAPAGGAEDQFKGAIITFDADTTTPALRSQKTDITASTNAAAPELTVTPLTTAPAAGDTFSVT